MGFSWAMTSSSSDELASPFLRRRAKSLFRSKARSMVRRQWASLQTKPSFTIRVFFSISSDMACSTGLPKNWSKLFWLLNLNCSRLLSGFSRRASAMSLMHAESRPLASTFKTCSVVFFLSDSASSWPCGFIMSELANCRETMWVLCSNALMSLGAIRGSLWGGGMSLPLKLTSTSEGSFSHARCTIQTIQSPRLRAFAGSSTMSARSVISSTIIAKCWFTPVMASTGVVHANFKSTDVEPVGLAAVIL
mmetsp:Transcript_115396/g.306835  ORF Transcript_115396/g.306835 Transcript_115396/m.306835 type:complete len:249 (+) Transcript_115396:145-891(+)